MGRLEGSGPAFPHLERHLSRMLALPQQPASPPRAAQRDDVFPPVLAAAQMRSVVLVVALLAVLSMASVDPHDTEFNALVPMKHKKKKKHEAPADPDSLDPYKWPDLVVM